MQMVQFVYPEHIRVYVDIFDGIPQFFTEEYQPQVGFKTDSCNFKNSDAWFVRSKG